MNIKWLEDFVALTDCGSFTRAAHSRHVTQPAFSRRIRALEHWLGVELVNRNSYPLQLTPAGIKHLDNIKSVLAGVHRLRADIRGWSKLNRRVVVATQHSLSVSYCPAWYLRCRPMLRDHSLCINAMNLYECIEVFLAGQCDLLLCYVTPRIDAQLECNGIERIGLGHDTLIPVCAADRAGRPLVDINKASAVPLIAYPVESFLGDLIRTECMADTPPGVIFDAIYETALSEGVRSMVLNGMGMAWLPAGLIQAELADGTLAKVPGLTELQLQIALFRQRSSVDTPVSAIWQHLTQEQATTRSLCRGAQA